ncbi:MAG: TerB family tellurite resistance protein [Myxococcales bacterium]|nr:TerB family tellurite resistance protein [Myxococcales bacterium]
MATWNELADVIGTDPKFSSLDGEQVDAIVDLLALVMQVDNRIGVLEGVEFEQLVNSLPFVANKAARVEQQVERARDAIQAGQVDGFIAAAAKALPAELAESVFQMTAALAHADLKVHSAEDSVLLAIASALGIDGKRARALIDAEP